MANDKREGYVKLGYEVDQQSLNQIQAANNALIADLQKIGGEAVKTSATFDRLKQASATIARANDIEAVGKQFATLGKTINDDTAALIQMRQVLKEIGASASEVDKATRSFKEMQAASAAPAGGGGGIAGLQRTGRSLSGLGLGAAGDIFNVVDDIQDLTEGVQQLGESAKGLPGILGAASAAVGPLVVILGAATVAAKVFNDGLAAADAQIKKASDQISAYYQIIKDGTTESINAQIKRLEIEKRITDIELKDREANLKATQDKNLAEARANLDFFGELSTELEQAGLRGGELTKKIQELKDKSKDTQTQIDLYNKALGDSEVAAHDAAEAEKRLALERLKAIDRQMASEIEYQELAKHGTSDQVKQQLESLQIQADAVANAYSKVIEKTDQESQARAKDLKAQYDAITNHIKDLQALLPDLQASEKAKQTFHDLFKGIEDGAKKAQQAAQDAQKAINEALADRAQADERVAAVQQKFNDQTLRIETADKEARLNAYQKYEDTVAGIEAKAQQARADLQTKYADQLVDIARKAADDAAKALEGFEQRQADLRTTLGRDEAKAGRDAADKVLDIQIKEQRAEREALQDHLQRIKEIRQGDYVQDQKDLLDRNFQNIYLRRLGQTQQIEQENTKFTADQRKRQQAITDEVQDAQRQAQIARRERLIAFEQANADARLAYQRERQAAAQARQIELRDAAIARNRELEQQRLAKQRELQAAQQTYQRELADLTAKLARERTTLASAYDAELRLAAQYGKARVEAERKTQQALLDQANARLRAMQGGSARPTGHGVMEMAGGGWLDAGQMSMVNEAGSSGRESFNGVPLPGAGLFIPSQAGYVNPNGGGVNNSRSLNATFNIQAQDTEGVKREVVGILRQVMG